MLSRELQKAEFVPGKGACVPNGRKTKEETLKEAGIPIRTANDYEQLTGGREEQAQKVDVRKLDSTVSRSLKLPAQLSCRGSRAFDFCR